MLSQKGKIRFIGIAVFLVFLAFAGRVKFVDEGIQGYVEGDLTYVASTSSGRLVSLNVKRGDRVNKDQSLFSLEVEPQNLDLEQATMNVNLAQNEIKTKSAALKLAKLVLNRHLTLEAEQSVSTQAADEARTNHRLALLAKNQAQTNLKNAESALNEVQWHLNQKSIPAMKSAQVFDTYYLPGEVVPENKPVLSLLSDNDKYIVFYLPINELSKIKLGQVITVIGLENTQEMKTNQNTKSEPVKAKITFINPSAEYTPPIIYSVETNDKLVFRVEATPIDSCAHLHPGLPVRLSLTGD